MRNSVAVVLGLLVAGGTVSAQYLITTVAGGGAPPTPALATSVAFGTVQAVATDGFGNVYFAAGNLVFKVDISGVLTPVAGSSTIAGYSGDGGVATSARLNQPSGLAVDAVGNIYIADSGNNVIRGVASATGVITTLAGTGTAGYSGDGGQATSARLNKPQGVAVDAAGSLYIADTSNYAVRKVPATGIITTFAGNGTQGDSGDGGPATGAQLNGPSGVAVDGAGNVYIVDALAVRKVAAATGTITTAASGSSDCTNYFCHPQTPISIALDDAGNLYITSPTTFDIREVAAANGSTSVVYSPTGGAYWSVIAADGYGNLYLAGYFGIERVAVATGVLTEVAGSGGSLDSGDGGPATAARFDTPADVAVDGSGNLYIADAGNTSVIRMVAAATGIITTVAGGGSAYADYTGPATSAQLNSSGGVALDGFGNLYIADSGDQTIRKVAAATGVITTVAGNGTNGYSGDGGPATSAQLWGPSGVAVDGSGNLYIADSLNHAIRKVTAATGIITTVANIGTGSPVGVALDGSGNIYVADNQNNVILKVAAATGVITTVAGNGSPSYSGDGGPATLAGLQRPGSVAVDASGNLYIADLGNNAIRKVAASTGIINTVAGTGTAGYSGDGGPATSAQLNGPMGVAVDGAGDVYIADTGNGVIRMLLPVATRAVLSVTSSHASDFAGPEPIAGSYSIVVGNNANAGPTTGAVTVTETLPAGLTLVSMSGAGWNCVSAVCTRSDVLSPGASYPPILAVVNVGPGAPSQVTNQVLVSGGGSQPTGATDVTRIMGPPPAAPVLAFPANGATGALVAPTLLWNASGGAIGYNVYFGASSTPPQVTSTTGTSYAPGVLNSGTTYYWQIVAQGGSGSAGSEIWSFTTGLPAIGSTFVPVAPCRVADTRGAGGPFGGPSMTAGSIRSFAIPSSGCGIPATAQAYSLNVTVVPAGPLSFLTLWPSGQSQPVVSTLNSFSGTVVANAAIVPAGTNGAVSVYVSDESDVILDINGYFDEIGAVGSSMFYAATPCRVVDTRGEIGLFAGPSLVAGQVRDFPILFPCGTQAAATAYSLNVTAIPGTDFLGYLTIWPAGQAQPDVSTLNSWTGKVVANAALVPVGANYSISVFVTDPANLVLDINGYFGQPGGAGQMAFYPVTPCRVVDTRGAAGPLGGPEMEAQSVRSFVLPAGVCPVPSNAAAYALNVTVVPEGYLGYLSAWPTGVSQPLVSTLNSFDGSVVANAAIVQAGTDGAVSIYVTGRTQVILDINGYFAP